MIETGKAQELFNETLAVWREASQRMLAEVVDLGAATAREGIRLCGELQRTTIDALRQNQATAAKWQTSWKDAAIDPTGWYGHAVAETVAGVQQAFKLADDQAQSVTRSVERLQTTAAQAGKGIQETLNGTVAKVKDIYATT